MIYQYPRTKFVDQNSIVDQIKHVRSETHEVLVAEDILKTEDLFEEIIDLHHSTETLLRIAEEKYGMNKNFYQQKIIEKNAARGYYKEDKRNG